MDTGIKIEYTGFHQEVADSDSIWQKDDVEFQLFSTTSVVPGTEIVLEPNTTINAATGSVDFYARFKLDYKFYTDLEGTAEATGINPTDVLVPSADFINSAWVESGDGFYYLATGTTLDVLTPGGTAAAFFADGAKYTINTNIGGEGFGYQVDADTTIVRADVILTLEVAQVGTPWSVTPLPVVEDLSTNVLQDTSGNAVTDVVSGTTYQIVDSSNNGLKYTFTLNEPLTVNASVLSSGVSNLSSVVVDPNNVDGTAEVTGYTGSPTDVVIPDYIVVNGKSYEVTIIDFKAFEGCTTLMNVTIPDTVTVIQQYAFKGCTSLMSVCGGQSVNRIDGHAFESCKAMTSILFSDNLVEIGEYAFNGCMGLTSIIIPDSVTSISPSVFRECASLQKVSIGKGLKTIYSYAFYGCGKLNYLSIGENVEEISSYSFYRCYSLESVEIPDSVTSISSYAFQRCSGLKSITIPDSVTYLGKQAFADCNKLEEVVVGDGVTKIGESAFDQCQKLKNVTLGTGIVNIADYAFQNCNTLESIVIPNSTKTIGKGAFTLCKALVEVTIGSDVTSIGDLAFSSCQSLTSVNIPDSVTSIGNSAFNGCLSIISVNGANGVTSIGNFAFKNCTNLTTMNISDSLTSIGHGAFAGCLNLEQFISNNVIYVTSDSGKILVKGTEIVAFAPYEITQYTIPGGITSIKAQTFSSCTSLQNITIPDSVTSIGNSAFYSCSNLTGMTVLATTPPTLGNSTSLPSNTILKTIYVPVEAVDAYKADATWGTYNIQPIA